MPAYRSRTTTHGRNMAGARGLWRATGMKNEDFGKPIIAVVNSFTQFVPGHVHLKDLGQLVAREIEKAGGVAKEFNTIAVDDGIAMGHDGMLYSLPSREIIADSVEYMVNAHCADAMVCISNCDKITPGMLMAALRINIPTVFVSGGPMESGKVNLKGKLRAVDLIDAMVAAADDRVSDEEVEVIERSACPTCGSCSGMFTANSMNCLTEALGLSLPGNGSVLATHADRKGLFVEAGHLIVDLARRYYEQDDTKVLPRNIANFKAFEMPGRGTGALGYRAHPERERAQFLQGSTRRCADAGCLQPGPQVRGARCRSRGGLHPRRRARLFQRRRSRRSPRQHRRRRLHRKDRWRRCEHPDIRRAGARAGKPGRRGRGDPDQQDQARRYRRDYLRRPARRPRHAGDAVS